MADLWHKCTATLMLVLLTTSVACSDRSTSKPPQPDETSPFVFPRRKTANSQQRIPSTLARGSAIDFVEVAQQLGLSHLYRNGEQGQSIMVETLGGGCGWLDYDRDGLWDLYLNQGGDPTQIASSSQPTDALFRNQDRDGFVDTTTRAFLAEFGYGMGVAIGDYDNDGFDDIYVTNVGGNTLWKNQGDGTFEEVSESAGVVDERWSTSAAWADLDLDGDLDLYVCNYLIYDPLDPLECRTKDGALRICHPGDLDPWPDECFMNGGDGTFTREARQRGLVGDGSKALGVAIADFNNDGLPDIYVANDTTANFFFLNQGEAQFTEKAYFMGCAVDRNGTYQASMGIGVGDLDNNGFLDIYATHFVDESNTLYENLGTNGFQDITGTSGLHGLTRPFLGFGVVISDFNLDGWCDIFVTNGHVENYPDNPLHEMHPQLLVFNGHSWQDGSASAGSFFAKKYVGRGAAWCDFDRDGDADLAVVHQNQPTAILRNDSQRGHWLKFQFRGRQSNRRGIGCRVIVRSEGTEFLQELCGGTSYASSNQPALIFGLGDRSQPCEVEVVWPSGRKQHLSGVAVDREIVLDEPNPE